MGPPFYVNAEGAVCGTFDGAALGGSVTGNTLLLSFYYAFNHVASYSTTVA